MIVRIARVKVGNRQAPYINQDPALKSGVLAFAAHVFNAAAQLVAYDSDDRARISSLSDIPARRVPRR
jgi:hypothetical protein